ncbi:MAG: Na+/H+ antiporter NhaC family protein [Myxococcota bacterium]|jgi:Na+/H+ antiporter NhaC|nr:Na+/H+ antiporter NhaC family protein [Myxococcota bacterium]
MAATPAQTRNVGEQDKRPINKKFGLRRHLAFASSCALLVLLLHLTGGGRQDAKANALALSDLCSSAFEEPRLAETLPLAWQTTQSVLTAAGFEALLADAEGRLPVSLQTASSDRAVIETCLRQQGLQATDGISLLELEAQSHREPAGTLALRLELGNHKLPSISSSASRWPGPWWSILPPLLAIAVALFYGRALLALTMAVLLGALLMTEGHPLRALLFAGEHYVWGTFLESFKLYILGFTLALVGMVHVAARSGGNQGLIELIAKLARSARSTRVAIALMGFAIFFDDYANTLVVGSSARPLADRMRISREKLAYLTDSTAAPVAGLAILSTWIGYELGLFQVIVDELGIANSAVELFLGILPMRFYCILTLVFVLASAVMGRDFGPMLKAERRALARTGAERSTAALSEHKEGAPPRWYNAAIPVLGTILCVIVGIALDGGQVLAARGDAVELLSLAGWRELFVAADNGKVLFWSSIIGSAVAILLVWAQRILTIKEALLAWLQGLRLMWVAVAILLLAWSIQKVTDDLGTSYYLVSVLEPLIHPLALALLVFLAAAAVAFATGTSWGTMGILIPTVGPLAWFLTGDLLITYLCLGAVLDGAIFGDHCSPISDTTVMSSLASGCELSAHVKTQFPYALVVMTIAAGFGYVGLPLGLPGWLALGLGTLSILLVLRLLGQRTDAPSPNS